LKEWHLNISPQDLEDRLSAQHPNEPVTYDTEALRALVEEELAKAHKRMDAIIEQFEFRLEVLKNANRSKK
jgi:hypothetical protein